MSDATQNKTLADFDNLQTDTEKCTLLMGYIEKSKKWLEEIGRRGEKGRWVSNLKSYRPQHKDLAEVSGVPKVRFYLIYGNIKTMMPEIGDKWPIIQFAPNQSDDKPFNDKVQEIIDAVLTDAEFNSIAQAVVQRGIVQESSLLRIFPHLTADGRFYVEVAEADIFSWFPAPGFSNDGFRMLEGDALYQSFRRPVNAELLKVKYNVDAAVESVMEYSTAGQLGFQTDDICSALINEFYWVCKKDGSAYIRAVWFARVKNSGGNDSTAEYKILQDSDKSGDCSIKRLPIFRYVNDPDGLTGFGTGDGEPVANNQQEISNALSNAFTVLKRHALPTIFMSEDYYKNAKESVLSRFMAGLPIVRRQPTDIQLVDPPTFNQGAMPLMEFTHGLSKVVAGIYEAIAGDVKYSGTPMGAILALQEASRARVRDKIQREIASWQRDIGRYLLGQLMAKDARVKELIGQSDPGSYDVKVIVAGGLPKGRYATEARAQELLKLGLFTPFRAIDDLAEPDTEQIKQEYIEYNGLQEHIAEIQAQKEAEQEFEKTCMELLNIYNNRLYVEGNLSEVARYKITEDHAAKLLLAFPDLAKSGVWGQLPPQIQDKLTMVFKTVPVQNAPAPDMSGQTQQTKPREGVA